MPACIGCVLGLGRREISPLSSLYYVAQGLLELDQLNGWQATVALRVLLIDESPERARQVETALFDSGYAVVACVGDHEDVRQAVARNKPDLIIIDMDSPDRDTLEGLGSLARTQDFPLPVVMFSQHASDTVIAQAVGAGVCAYVAGHLTREHIKPVLDIAVARFREYRVVKQELEETKTKLTERKLIDRAKGLLMSRKGLQEEEAFQTLRKLAMNRNMTLGQAAQYLIEAAALFA